MTQIKELFLYVISWAIVLTFYTFSTSNPLFHLLASISLGCFVGYLISQVTKYKEQLRIYKQFRADIEKFIEEKESELSTDQI